MTTDKFLQQMNGCKVCMIAAQYGGISKDFEEYVQQANFTLGHEIERAKKGNIHPDFKKFILTLIKSGYKDAYCLYPNRENYHNAKGLMKPEVALAYTGFTYGHYVWVDMEGMVIHFGTSQASFNKIYIYDLPQINLNPHLLT